MSESTDVASPYSLDAIVKGIADDLVSLRRGEISIKDAEARAMLAKQYMNGVRLVINARQSLEAAAKPVAIGGGK
ncbi:hypothetical protein KFK14_11455 [Sphingobium phenoxybenzoativorans]|uniref:Uncharacterized protein n=1 Tax=Sphingobium phenoxybenzoativorans TaxID=1592790 RepID=A0A975Q3D8_9SPHN|nr:hypothetical protein [Sphingobium phenoxybenzoativorans]QUT07945.1 hypothetical protein KFK14_11455 [Sphingobium phenoxybenzoativorans]